MLPTRYWQDLPWTAFPSLPRDTVAVLPVAAIEQHGPHLPVSVDRTINEGVLTRTLALLPDALPLLVLLNSHGGQPQVVDIVCRRLRATSQMFAVACMWSRLGKPGELVSPVEARHGIHGGFALR